MLLGLSYENILKGILIICGGPATSKGTLSSDFKNHNLVALAQSVQQKSAKPKSSIDFSAEELEFFAHLTEMVMWQGRYPIPLKSSAYTAVIITRSEDVQSVERTLWSKLKTYMGTHGWAKLGGGVRRKLAIDGDQVVIGEEMK